MGREKVFCLSLRRFARTSTAALIALVLAGAARAGTIQVFDVSGMAQNLSGMDLGSCPEGAFCSSSGKRTIDVTSTTMFPPGRITAVDITFPGQPDFNVREGAGPVLRFGYWMFSEANHASETLGFLPEPTQASLVDLDIGSLSGEFTVQGPAGNALYAGLGGSITPAPGSPPVPGPSSLALLGTGLIGLGALARRNLKRRTTASIQTARRRPVLVGAKWPSRDLESNRLLKTIVSIEVSALYSVAQNSKNASGNVAERSTGSN